MNWTCQNIEDRLSEYLDGLLDSAERESFADHANACPRCRPMLERVAGLVRGLHALEMAETPPLLVDAILAKTSVLVREEKKLARDWRAWLEWATWREALLVAAQPRFAMAAVSLVITFTLVSQALGIEWRQVGWSDLNPANIARNVDRRANLIYARGVKFVSDLRVVYEIQTRLRQGSETAPAEQAPPQNQNPATPKKEKELNRALQPIPSLLASVIPAMPGRSLR
jgi:anti-sigma factor RsiW